MQVIASYSSGGASRGANLILTISQYPKLTAITDWGDRIRTCDLLLPKHSISKMRQHPWERS